MAKKRTKKELTSDQALWITCVVWGVIFFITLMVTLMGVAIDYKSPGEIVKMLICGAVWGYIELVVLVIVLYQGILKGPEREKAEKLERKKKKIIQLLSPDEWREVYFSIREGQQDVLAPFFAVNNIKFYAKLGVNGRIHIIGKADDMEFYDNQTTDYQWFDKNFSFEEKFF